MMPQGLKLDAAFTELTVGNRIEDPSGVRDLGEAMEGRSAELSRWLLESDAVFALILAADGTIRIRNRAADRIFCRDSSGGGESGFGQTIWDYLQCTDAGYLRRLLSDSPRAERHFLLNLTTGQNDRITGEVSVFDCAGGFLLLGAVEQRQAQRLQNEMQTLTNQLSITTRELNRKNKALEEANRTIDRLARTDALTGLANRRMFDETLELEMARARRQNHALTLIIADIDHFKSINDEHGHVAGDHVLAGTGKLFGTRLRAYDLAARYGGEEFALLLPETSLADGAAIAERLRIEIASVQIPDSAKQITISLGVAGCADSEPAEAFVARADAALYRAKRTGRNRVEIDGPGGSRL